MTRHPIEVGSSGARGPVHAILFDADGVVINGERASEMFERDHGITREMTAPFFRGPFRDCLEGRADLKEAIAPWLPRWGWKGTVDEHLDAWFRAEHALDADLLCTVDALRSRGVACYLATNQERHRTEYLRTEMGLGSRFDGVFSSADIGSCKPDAEYFRHIIDALGLEPSRILFVDDTPANVEGARRCGLTAELYTGLDSFLGLIDEGAP